MYCNYDYCSSLLPCDIHCQSEKCLNMLPCNDHYQYEYEVESMNTIWSGFTSIDFDCEDSKHREEFFGHCSHFRAWRPSTEGFTFFSDTIDFFEESNEYWHEGMICNLCQQEIQEDEELVLNLKDMCQFHEGCLRNLLHRRNPEVCPGCDTTKCKACWKCSY